MEMDCYDVIRMQNVAYVLNLVTLAQVQMAGMVAENQGRLSRGEALAHGEEEFHALIESCQLGHNAVLTNLHGGL